MSRTKTKAKATKPRPRKTLRKPRPHVFGQWKTPRNARVVDSGRVDGDA